MIPSQIFRVVSSRKPDLGEGTHLEPEIAKELDHKRLDAFLGIEFRLPLEGSIQCLKLLFVHPTGCPENVVLISFYRRFGQRAARDGDDVSHSR